MRDIKSFHELLAHYRFTDAVSAPFRQSAVRSKKRLLKKILKEVDEYTLFFSLSLTVLFFLSRTGLKMSLGAAKIVAASLLAIGVTVPVSYTAVKLNQYYRESRIEIEEKITETAFMEKEDVLSYSKEKSEKRKNAYAGTGIQTISFKSLRFSGGDQSLASEFSGVLKTELERILETRKSLSLATASRRADYTLVGSIREKRAGYFVSLRIIDVKSGEILKGEYFTAETSEDFGGACAAAVERLLKIVGTGTRQE